VLATVLYWQHENRARERNGYTTRPNGANRRRTFRQTARDLDAHRVKNFPGPGEASRKYRRQWGPQNPLQDAGERLVLLPGARPIVIPVREFYVVTLEDRHP